MARNSYTGEYRDDQRAAMYAALADVKVDHADFIECSYGNESIELIPLDPDARWEYNIEFFFSTTREQFKAKVTRVPYVRDV